MRGTTIAVGLAKSVFEVAVSESPDHYEAEDAFAVRTAAPSNSERRRHGSRRHNPEAGQERTNQLDPGSPDTPCWAADFYGAFQPG
jgi:hypothetical protein